MEEATEAVQVTKCSACGHTATKNAPLVQAHTTANIKSSTTPRCKSAECSKVCVHCWNHFVPAVIDEHIHTNAGYGAGCEAGPFPDPLAKKGKK